MPKKYKIHPVLDNAESYYTNKETIFSLPARLLLVGKSQYSGKSSWLVNAFLKKEFYLDDFLGDNIYIISKSLDTDEKLKLLVKCKQIPDENLFHDFDEDILMELYKDIEENYKDMVEEKERPPNVAFIFDDISFKGDLSKQKGVVSLLFSNGRHLNISTFITGQRYGGSAGFSTSARENSTGVIVWSCSDRQLEQIETDHNRLGSKQQFKRMMRDITKNPYSTLVINYSNPFDTMYLDSNFEKIDYDKYIKKL